MKQQFAEKLKQAEASIYKVSLICHFKGFRLYLGDKQSYSQICLSEG